MSAAEIRIPAGTYYLTSQLTFSSDKTVTADVVGEPVVLDGQNSNRLVKITGGTLELIGLTLQNGYDPTGGGVDLYYGTVILTNCVIRFNHATVRKKPAPRLVATMEVVSRNLPLPVLPCAWQGEVRPAAQAHPRSSSPCDPK